MPIYEYSCPKCGREFEELSRHGETPPCPHCGAVQSTRLMSACARRVRGGEAAPVSGGGCGGCSGGNCSACSR